MTDAMNAIEEFEKALLMMDRVTAEKIMREAVQQSSLLEAVETLVVTAFERIGQGWQEGHIALAQTYMSAMICEEVMDSVISSHPKQKKIQPKIGIAVLEDHHALGKRIICSILRASGYEVIDYGHGVSAEILIEKTVQDKLELLLISTLMLSSALKVRQVIEGLKEQGATTKVIAGGAPFRLDTELAKTVGVDTLKNASDLPALIQGMVK